MAYLAVGLPMFLAPSAVAPVFAWKISPMVTMTIGAWCLGNAWLAAAVARRWSWRLVYSALLYLWLFGLFETIVLVAFRDRLVLDHPIAWLYVVALGVNLVAAGVGTVDWLRHRPTRTPFGEPVGRGLRAAIVGYVALVALIAGYGLVARIGGPATDGSIFPDELSAFTLRSFAAFYLALVLGALPLVRERSREVVLFHGYASIGLVILITIAALASLGRFDLIGRPGGWIYLGAYVVVGVPVAVLLLRDGTGHDDG